MISKLCYCPKYYHLKMIHDYPKGISNNRFKYNADKWVESLRHPHIKTYQQYFINQQTQQHQMQIKLTQKQQSSIENIKYSYKPGVSTMTNFFRLTRPQRPDDLDMQRDVQDMTIKKFIQQGRQNFTQIHKLVLYGIAFVIVHITLYFIFFHGKEPAKNQRVKVLNAQMLQTYHFQSQQSAIKQIIEKIEIVNNQYQKRLTQSKSQ